ncbi:MAG: Fic family protein [Ignavibacteria bacterium]|nr:Fic family protein [Ignavibacteria bacterium]
MSVKKNISSKYKANIKSEFEPGSNEKILKNKLGIKSKKDLDSAEYDAYVNAENTLIKKVQIDHEFCIEDIHNVNKIFLGNIYNWAGKLRDVNISKGGFTFASAFALPEALKDFEKNVLRRNTPPHGDLENVIRQIAEVHTELLILHPYREGNGRTARLLAILMAYQAGLPGIDFSFIKTKGKEFDNYIKAVEDGMDQNYVTMKLIIKKGINLSLKKFVKS